MGIPHCRTFYEKSDPNRLEPDVLFAELGPNRSMKIFLDSNIVQHAATTYRMQVIHFGRRKLAESLVRKGPVRLVHKRPAENERLRLEIECLFPLSSRLKTIGAVLIMDHENNSEIRRAGRFRKEYFHSSEIEYAKRPPEYNTTLGLPSWMNPGPTKNQFHNFLHQLRNPRFLDLAKCTGGLQGSSVNYNQLADAYFLWCAEENGADYILTLDFKLHKLIKQAKSLIYAPKVVTATELLKEIENA